MMFINLLIALQSLTYHYHTQFCLLKPKNEDWSNAIACELEIEFNEKFLFIHALQPQSFEIESKRYLSDPKGIEYRAKDTNRNECVIFFYGTLKETEQIVISFDDGHTEAYVMKK